MGKQKNIIKNILIAIGALILLVAGYGLFFGGKGGDSESQIATTVGPQKIESESGKEILQLLLNLKSLKLNASVLSSKGFRSLKDFGQAIPPQPRGRENPFAPFGARTEGAEPFLFQ